MLHRISGTNIDS